MRASRRGLSRFFSASLLFLCLRFPGLWCVPFRRIATLWIGEGSVAWVVLRWGYECVVDVCDGARMLRDVVCSRATAIWSGVCCDGLQCDSRSQFSLEKMCQDQRPAAALKSRKAQPARSLAIIETPSIMLSLCSHIDLFDIDYIPS
jgi:hypothetical protein